MISKFNGIIQFRFLFSVSRSFNSSSFHSSTPNTSFLNYRLFCTREAASATKTLDAKAEIGGGPPCCDLPKDTTYILRRWGCSDNDICRIFLRRPSIRNMDLANLQSKLNLLTEMGITSSDLVKIINCRPRFLNCRINQDLDERLQYLQSLFGSREMLLMAINRNPSLLTYDLHNKIKPVIAMYDSIGVRRTDLVPMLLSRPTLIPRSKLNAEKMDYICRTSVPPNSKMYKYVVTLIAISRLETIREKMANLEKFGFSDDEVLQLFGRSPLVLTLSVDKVQRNMTFVLSMMKLPARVVLDNPFLLFCNLEAVLKPRVLLAEKLQVMDLVPQIKGPLMMRALRMTDKRFVGAFVGCHQKDVANELMEYYTNAKGIRRLAESSKKHLHKGFPF
ncbi:unnamed protein product [Ilex paraguariensis]|uniref:Uncharacterized protein n=1 Tax=Ilex paraguariensis TaxID=185542 RepID=A0ABC8UDG6_9AQUA